MSEQAAFRQALNEGDSTRVRHLWAVLYSHLPQPTTAEEAEVVMHTARSGAQTVDLEKRLYSHAWLEERGYRSMLPPELRPKRIIPVTVLAVGVAVGTTSNRPDRKEEAKAIEAAMAEVAGDMITHGITDSARISQAMWQARDNYIKRRMI